MMKNSMVVAAVFALVSSPSALATGDVGKGQEIAAGACAGCHNPDGNSIIPINPNLAGQHAEYLVKQLMDFKAGGDQTPNRNSPVMAAMVAPLTQEDMENVAAFYAAQTPVSTGNANNNEDMLEKGEILYHGGNIDNGVPACASCHGPTGTGIPPHYPVLAGQHAEYTYTQLDLFNKRKRTNDDGVMQKVLTRMSGAEKRAVSEYIQSMETR
ncbi:Cytochrome c553 [Nitrosomonas sp. Nm51]|uniref:c-type cytochrome n=1 Tax=Nitrosomonas sp. Nm51 TaxID=133720 RepID=UPI0008CC9C58|nr:cytochrome c4 [Nitrosomonas sp. Nm51]SER73433.1 Cytochrome c553 [Nitrosomonas sp. Nm51]